MTSKNWYFSLTKEDMKRRIWLLALTGLLLFFSFPVVTILYAGAIDGYGNYQLGLEQFQYRMESLISVRNGWMFFLVVIWSVVYGSSGFSYLNSKSKVDFYHSIPVRREKLFLVHYLNGFLMLALLYLVFLLMAIGLATASGADFSILIEKAVTAYLINLAFFLFLYATVVTAMMMTGNQIVALLGMAVFFFYIPLMGALVEGFCSLWLLTYWSDGSMVRWASRFSPFILYLEAIEAAQPMKYGMAAAAAGIVISLFALWLYRKRPSEGAEKSMVFPLSRPLVRIAIVLCSGMAGAAFGWGLRSSIAWSLFFLICGSVIAHCVIETIYHADFRKLFSHPFQMVGCIAAVTLIVLGFRYDLLGYDQYVPSAKEIRSVSVDVQSLDTWAEFGSISDEPEYGVRWKSADRTSHLFETMRLTETEPVLQIASLGSKKAGELRKLESEKLYNRYSGWYNVWNGESEDRYTTVVVQFQKHSGRKITRCYTLPVSQIESELVSLYEMESYKTAMYPILVQSEELAYIYYERYDSGTNIWQGESQKAEEFRKAYSQDLMEQTIADRKYETPVARVRFVTANEDKKLKEETLQRDSWERRWVIQQNQYPVYPSFKRTIACLEAAGISLEAIPEGVYITGGVLEWYAESVSETFPYEAEATTYGRYKTAALSQKEVQELLPYMIFESDSYMNFFVPTEGSINVRVFIANKDDRYHSAGEEESSTTWYFYFPENRVPDLLQKKIETTL